MSTQRRTAAYFSPLTLFVASCAALMVLHQAVLLRNLSAGHDQSWYLLAAQRLLAGSQLYGPWIAETNPPLIVWFSVLPVVLARAVHCSSIAALRLVVVLLLFGSVAWCIRILRRYPPTAKISQWSLPALGILYIEFRTGPYDFGQREQLFVILALPCIVAAATNVIGHLSTIERSALGLVAGIAVCFKPQFVLVFLALELVLFVYTRSLRRLISPEILGLLGIGLLYLLLVHVATPLYTKETVPLLFNTYWAFGTSTAFALALSMKKRTLLILIMMLTCIVFRRSLRFYMLVISLLICSIAASIAYAIQHVDWGYHRYPSTAFLILAIFFFLLDLLYTHVEKLAGPQISLRTGLICISVALLGGFAVYHPWPFIQQQVSGHPELDQFFAQYEVPPNHPPTTVFIFSTDLEWFSSVSAHGLDWGSRFPCLWTLPAIVQNELGPSVPSALFKQLSPEEIGSLSTSLRSQVTEDLNLHQPSVVLVEQCTVERPCQALGTRTFDTIAWFLQSPEFAAAWSHYSPQPGAPKSFNLYRRVS